MSYDPNDRWTAALESGALAPVYVFVLDGSTKFYSTRSRTPGAGPWCPDLLGGAGDMEDVAGDWTAVGTAGTMSQDAVEMRQGAGCMKLERTTSAGSFAAIRTFTGVLPSKWYTVVVHAKATAAISKGIRVKIQDNTSAVLMQSDRQTWLSTPQYWEFLDVDTDGYSALVFSFKTDAVADPGDNYRIYIEHWPGNTETIYVDDVFWYGPSDTEYAKPYLEIPSGGGGKVDPIEGRSSVQSVTIELLDVDDEITALVATDALDAEVSSLINRKGTIFAGFTSIDVSDYASRFVGYIGGDLKMTRDLGSYSFTLESALRLLDGSIMTNATDTALTTVVGNFVNLYYSILADDFSTGGDFPLESIANSPTGLGISTSALNLTQIQNERDIWHETTVVTATFEDDEDGKTWLEREIFRVFQCFPAISGDGLLGLRFHAPALPASSAPVVDADDVIGVPTFTRQLSDHINKFTFRGDFTSSGGDFGSVLYSGETAEDLADQAATGETIEFYGESELLTAAQDGAAIATELAGRHRIRYLSGPASVGLSVPITRQDLEQGDVVAVTDDRLPDLFSGTRGLAGRLMTILSVGLKWDKATLDLALLDTGYRRYGVIAPDATVDYTAASEVERGSFAWIGDASGNVSSSGGVGTVAGYRLI